MTRRITLDYHLANPRRKLNGPLRIADLMRDADVVQLAKRDAADMLAVDPDLSGEANQKIRERVLLRYGKVLQLGDVG